MKKLLPAEVTFSRSSVVDDSGTVFFYDGRVFRSVWNNHKAEFFREVLGSSWISDVFDAGLVKTWIPEDLTLVGAELVLEHEYIPYATHPAENTSYMHWLSAKTLLRVATALSRHGLVLKDAHPWNLMFRQGKPLFVDFGSIVSSENLKASWLDEFFLCFGVPIWLASKGKMNLAREYRRQHMVGFGLHVFKHPVMRKVLFRSLMQNRKKISSQEIFFNQVDDWLETHQPVKKSKENWGEYRQSGDFSKATAPSTIKHKFVYDVLVEESPKKVLDCAANKGFYSELAASLGASVVSFDYEEFCVDRCLALAQTQGLDITPALMDFCHPTPPSGLGLLCDGAYQRFESDIALVLGLGHHLCISQQVPVSVFCGICMSYANQGVVFEYVDPDDKHVASWGKPIPSDYSLSGFVKYFSKKFPNYRYSEQIIDNDLNRQIVYFGK